MINLINLLDYSGLLLGVLGVILVGRINKMGYVLLLICNLSYGLLGYIQGNYGLLSVSIIMGALDIYYWNQWRKNQGTLSGTIRRLERIELLENAGFKPIAKETKEKVIASLIKNA